MNLTKAHMQEFNSLLFDAETVKRDVYQIMADKLGITRKEFKEAVLKYMYTPSDPVELKMVNDFAINTGSLDSLVPLPRLP